MTSPRRVPRAFRVGRAGKVGRVGLIWTAGLVLLAVLITLGVTYGSTSIPVGDVWRIFGDRLLGRDLVRGTTEQVIWNIRFPRPLLAAAAGAGLGLVGAAVQAIVRNPLADPYLLGVSSGAAFGAVAVIVTGGGALGAAIIATVGQNFVVPAAAFAGAFLALWVVWLAAGRAAASNPLRLVLAGIAIGQLFGSLTSYLVLQADDINQTHGILHWLMGSLSSAIGPSVPIVAGAVGFGGLALFALSRGLNALAMGDETAAALGVDIRRLRIAVFLVTSLMTGVIVAFTGAIGFVGLLIPHVGRLLVGADHRVLLPTAALLGACLLAAVDLLSRVLVPTVGQEVPINVFTAILGAPLLLFLVRRKLRA